MCTTAFISFMSHASIHDYNNVVLMKQQQHSSASLMCVSHTATNIKLKQSKSRTSVCEEFSRVCMRRVLSPSQSDVTAHGFYKQSAV